MGIPERRSESRLALPKGSVSSPLGSGRILDISSGGVRVEINTRCVFARGETHRLVLSDLLESVEVEGRVRWTQSSWRDSLPSQNSEYIQIAGIAFSRLITDQPAGIWSGLMRKMAQPTGELAPERIEPAPERVRPQNSVQTKSPLAMIEPIDGSTVSQESVDVICTIEKPETLTGFKLNGVDAFVWGDLGTATVKLHQGTNRIVSMVYRRNGTYSTYLVGNIIRSKTH